MKNNNQANEIARRVTRQDQTVGTAHHETVKTQAVKEIKPMSAAEQQMWYDNIKVLIIAGLIITAIAYLLNMF